MKKLFALLLCLFLSSCNQSSPTYPPPVNLGSGTILIFSTTDSAGNQCFNEVLSAYFQEHPNMRFAGMRGIENDKNGNPTQYIVVAEVLTSPAPPQPTTLPSVNVKGEIQYPEAK